MRTAFAILAALAFIVLAAGDPRASPIAPAGVGSNSKVILVAEGCGRGWHRGPYGGCQRNVSPRWPCWYVRGPYGRWRLICH